MPPVAEHSVYIKGFPETTSEDDIRAEVIQLSIPVCVCVCVCVVIQLFFLPTDIQHTR